MKMTAQEVADGTICQSQEMARNFCLSRGCQFRVVKVDGEALMVTRDYVPTRVNVEIKNNEVAYAYLG